ncbi:MAG: hypothetical protein ABGW97_15885 [Christiangramia sp.]|uniref:hypothetical protein n=1 Tax=Christiangramia sp. TaxID=1931228 RepID=UPI0032422579
MSDTIKKPWCKIYEIEGNQILVQIKMNTDEDQLELSQKVELEGMFLEASIGFTESKTTAQEAFDKYGEQNAQNFLNYMNNLINEN